MYEIKRLIATTKLNQTHTYIQLPQTTAHTSIFESICNRNAIEKKGYQMKIKQIDFAGELCDNKWMCLGVWEWGKCGGEKKDVIRKHQPINHIIETEMEEWNIFQRDVIDISILLSIEYSFSLSLLMRCCIFVYFFFAFNRISWQKFFSFFVALSYSIFFLTSAEL